MEYLDDLLIDCERLVIPDDLSRWLLPLIDATKLNADLTAEDVTALCQCAVSEQGAVAAVCIPPTFVPQAKQQLKNTAVQIASVANFPEGTADDKTILGEIKRLLDDEADEIDLVLPHQRYLAGEENACLDLIAKVRTLTQDRAVLKIILETGVFTNETTLHMLCRDLIRLGVDFLKTSTGMRTPGAELRKVGVMLNAILGMYAIGFTNVGIKISGGVQTLQQVAQYRYLIEQIIGNLWVSPATVRFGSSKLLPLIT